MRYLCLTILLSLVSLNAHANLVTNGDFDTSPEVEWNPYPGVEQVWDETTGYGDSTSAKLEEFASIHQAAISIEVDTSYELTFWYKNTGGGTMQVDVGKWGYPWEYSYYNGLGDNDWKYASIVFNAEGTGLVDLIFNGSNSESGAIFWVDQVSLVVFAATPEPGTLLLGFSILYPFVRRRRFKIFKFV